MSGFDETQFPPTLASLVGGPSFRTEIVTTGGGYEQRNMAWSRALRRFRVVRPPERAADFSPVLAFFLARGGRARAFRVKDWLDFTSRDDPTQAVTPTDQAIGTGDGTTTAFQLTKTYAASGGLAYQASVSKPVAATVRVAVDGLEKTEGPDWTVDTTTGVVTFGTAPAVDAAITAGFQYDVPARFDADALEIERRGNTIVQWPELGIVEVRL